MMLTPEKIKALRSLKGWTLRKLGEKATVHYTLVYYIEKGKRNLTYEVEQKLLKAFDIQNRATLDHLIEFYNQLQQERSEH